MKQETFDELSKLVRFLGVLNNKRGVGKSKISSLNFDLDIKNKILADKILYGLSLVLNVDNFLREPKDNFSDNFDFTICMSLPDIKTSISKFLLIFSLLSNEELKEIDIRNMVIESGYYDNPDWE